MRAISQIFQFETRRFWHDSVLNPFDEHVHGNATSSNTAAFVSYTNSKLQPFQYSQKKEIEPTIYRNSMIQENDEGERYVFVITINIYILLHKGERQRNISQTVYIYISFLN